jgi:hypothetical protein
MHIHMITGSIVARRRLPVGLVDFRGVHTMYLTFTFDRVRCYIIRAVLLCYQP